MMQTITTLILATLLVGCAAQCNTTSTGLLTTDTFTATLHINLTELWPGDRWNGPNSTELFDNGTHTITLGLTAEGGAFVNDWTLADNGEVTVPSIGNYGDAQFNNTIEFDPPVAAFLAKLNYDPGFDSYEWGPPVIEVVDSTDELVACYDLHALAPISTPDATNGYAWRGVRYDLGIKTLRFRGAQIIFWDIQVDQVIPPVPVAAPVANPAAAPVQPSSAGPSASIQSEAPIISLSAATIAAIVLALL